MVQASTSEASGSQSKGASPSSASGLASWSPLVCSPAPWGGEGCPSGGGGASAAASGAPACGAAGYSEVVGGCVGCWQPACAIVQLLHAGQCCSSRPKAVRQALEVLEYHCRAAHWMWPEQVERCPWKEQSLLHPTFGAAGSGRGGSGTGGGVVGHPRWWFTQQKTRLVTFHVRISSPVLHSYSAVVDTASSLCCNSGGGGGVVALQPISSLSQHHLAWPGDQSSGSPLPQS
mmetsp:Transcript_128687/g.349295  ORF Transcript_128687/g.349295 Transcript_128687/m.349295 type:complete len:232 (+) Transcript_128687:1476-2171(+)